MWCVRCRHTPNKNVQLNATLRHPFNMVNPSLEWLRTLKFLIVSRCTLTLIWWVNKRMVDFKVLDHNLSKDDEIRNQVRWVMELIKDPGSWIWMIIISPDLVLPLCCYSNSIPKETPNQSLIGLAHRWTRHFLCRISSQAIVDVESSKELNVKNELLRLNFQDRLLVDTVIRTLLAKMTDGRLKNESSPAKNSEWLKIKNCLSHDVSLLTGARSGRFSIAYLILICSTGIAYLL